MSNRINGLIIAAIVAIALSACEGPANRNANTNANNANHAASPTPTAVANANTNTRTAPTREEYERDKERNDREAREQARGSGRTVGTGLNDAWLWTKTRFDLAAADDQLEYDLRGGRQARGHRYRLYVAARVASDGDAALAPRSIPGCGN